MKDLVLISGIILFWGFLTIILTGINADPLITDIDIVGNSTTDATLPDGRLNITDETFSSPSSIGIIKYLDMFVRMFTFRLPSSFPDSLNVFLNLFNYLLVGLLALLMFRQVRNGGG